MSGFSLRNLHIEVTTRCNLNCIYCLRRFWSKYELADMTFKTFTKIFEGIEELERINLYGFGEPLMNPRIVDMIAYARKHASNSKIFLSTNGMLLNQNLIEKMIESGLDSIAVSIDTVNPERLRMLRVGSGERVLKSFKSLCEFGKKLLSDIEIGVECVIMREGFEELPNVVEYAADAGADYVHVSHVIPYSKKIYDEACYTCISRKVLSILGENGVRELCEIREKASMQALSLAYAGVRNAEEFIRYFEMMKKLSERGYTANVTALCEEQHKIELALRVREVLERAQKVAESRGIMIKVPKIFSDSSERACPYEEKGSIYVRRDGKVAPCMEFAYTHPEYVNAHHKQVYEYIVGDVNEETLPKIVSSERFMNLSRMRRNLNANCPWCGDCPFSEVECWFIKDNMLDCYGNSPSCSECLYSSGLASCII